MKEELRFNWLDVFRAPRIALSLQKLWVVFLPLFVGYLVYVALTFLGFWVSGTPEGAGRSVLEASWGRSGLLPCAPAAQGVTFLGYLFWILGVAGLLGAGLVGATAVARATFLELKGETFFTYRELWGFARRHLKSVLLGPGGILLVIIGIAACGAFLGLLGRIPAFGPAVGVIPIVALSPIWLGISFFLVALIFVFLFSLLLAPAITATTRGDFFEVITETFSVAFSEPYRLVGYLAVLFATASVAVSVLGWLVKLAFKAMVGLLSLGMGDGFRQITAKAMQLLAEAYPALSGLAPGLGFQAKIGYVSVGAGVTAPALVGVGGAGAAGAPAAAGWLGFWGYVLAIVAALAGFLVIACYGAALSASGNTLIYLVLHKLKDEENLLEVEEEEEEEDEEDEDKEESEAEREQAEPVQEEGAGDRRETPSEDETPQKAAPAEAPAEDKAAEEPPAPAETPEKPPSDAGTAEDAPSEPPPAGEDEDDASGEDEAGPDEPDSGEKKKARPRRTKKKKKE